MVTNPMSRGPKARLLRLRAATSTLGFPEDIKNNESKLELELPKLQAAIAEGNLAMKVGFRSVKVENSIEAIKKLAAAGPNNLYAQVADSQIPAFGTLELLAAATDESVTSAQRARILKALEASIVIGALAGAWVIEDLSTKYKVDIGAGVEGKVRTGIKRLWDDMKASEKEKIKE